MNKRMIFLVSAVVFLACALPLAAQTTVTIGSGTGHNDPLSFPTPYGTNYMNMRQQYLYKASQIVSEGGSAGGIVSLGFRIYALNDILPVADYYIRMKHTAQTELSTTFEAGDYTEVWHQANYAPAATDWQTHTLSVPFLWDGSSNLLVDILSINAADSTENASVYLTSTSDYRSLRFCSQTEDPSTATAGTRQRAFSQLQMTIVAPPPPAVLVAPALDSDNYCNVILEWASGGGSPAGYKLYLGTDGGGTETPTSLVNGLDLGNVTSYTYLPFLPNNATIYWSIVPYLMGVEAENCPIWSFNTVPLSGTLYIGADGDFANFKVAIELLNHSGVTSSGVIFKVGGWFTENLPPITASGTENGRIVFEPVDESANPTIYQSGSEAPEYGIKLEGADYVTFDHIWIYMGANNLYGYWLSDGATHCIIQDCHVWNPAVGGGDPYLKSGIYSTGPNSYNSFLNNSLGRSGEFYLSRGIRLEGDNENQIYDNQITGNYMTNLFNYGIHLTRVNNTIIADNIIDRDEEIFYAPTFHGIYNYDGIDNLIHDNEIKNADGNDVFGIYIGNYSSGTQIYNNYIHDLCKSGDYSINSMCVGIYSNSRADIYSNMIQNINYTSVYMGQAIGIELNAGTNYKVYNNMINNIFTDSHSNDIPQVIGININNASASVCNNTIYLSGDGPEDNDNYVTTCIYFGSSYSLTLQNNIFVNRISPYGAGKTCALYSDYYTYSVLSPDTDNNIYYCGTPDSVYVIGYLDEVSYVTLDDYKAAVGSIEQNSMTEMPPFNGSSCFIRTNVLTHIEGNAIPISYITEDISGDPRNATTPDIGADEGDFMEYAIDAPQEPQVTYLGGTCTLQWQAVTGAATYNIYRSEDPNAPLPWTLIDTVTAPDTNYQLVITGQKGFYYVTASSLARE